MSEPSASPEVAGLDLEALIEGVAAAYFEMGMLENAGYPSNAKLKRNADDAVRAKDALLAAYRRPVVEGGRRIEGWAWNIGDEGYEFSAEHTEEDADDFVPATLIIHNRGENA